MILDMKDEAYEVMWIMRDKVPKTSEFIFIGLIGLIGVPTQQLIGHMPDHGVTGCCMI